MRLPFLLFAAAVLTFSSPAATNAAPAKEPLFGFHVGPSAPGRAPLTLHSDGNFYGAASGGDSGNGALFRLTPSGRIDWLSLSGIGGSRPGKNPDGALVLRPDGWLWGTTTAGGSTGTLGTVYRVRTDSEDYQVMVSFLGGQFTNFSGQNPSGELAADSSGWLWGATVDGGVGAGVIYKINETTGEFKVAANLPSGVTNPSAPLGMIFHGGFMWGMTAGGTHQSGTVFRLNPADNSRLTIGEFTGNNTIAPKPRGRAPIGKLTPDGLGYLWGATENGGALGVGTLFKVEIAAVGTATYPTQNVVEFSDNGASNKGAKPKGTLVADGASMLWGVTWLGGTGSKGTVFKVNPVNGTLTTVVDFGAPATVGTGITYPANALTYDGNGYVWGLANSGTDKWCCYKVKVADGTLTKVAEFSTSGPSPEGSLPKAAPVGTADSDWLYGTTYTGGDFGFGTLYRHNAATGDHETLVHFTGTSGAAVGANPAAKLHFHTDGSIWGSTSGGGTGSTPGSVFKYDPDMGEFTSITGFHGTFSTTGGPVLGSNPEGVLATGADGFIWGTGSGNGSIFKIDPATGLVTIVKAFGSNGDPEGSNPLGGVVLDSQGFIWGTTSRGGNTVGSSMGYGTVFKVNSLTGEFTSVIKFTGSSGATVGQSPHGDLVLDANGKIWGVTDTSVFAFDPMTGNITANMPTASATNYPLELSAGGGLYHHHDGFYYGVSSTAARDQRDDWAGGGILFRRQPGHPTPTTTPHSPSSGELYPGNVLLGGTVDMDGAGGTCQFEWGPTTTLGRTTNAVNVTGTDLSANILGLKGNTSYFFRLRINAPGGPYFGKVENFLTREINPVENYGITVQSPIGMPLTHNVSAISFGEVRTGLTAQQGVSIRNVSQSSISLTSAVISGPDAARFSVSTVDTTAMTSLALRGLTVTYTPGAEGNHQATLTINSTDPNRPAFVVPLSGNGVSEPEIIVEEAGGVMLNKEGNEVLDFGLGAVGGAAIPKQFLVRNTGNAVLESVSIEIVGAHAGDFALTGSLAASINAGGSSGFGVSFLPLAIGERNALLRITSSDPQKGMVEIRLKGHTATAPAIAVELQAGGAVTSGVGVPYGTAPMGSIVSKTFVIRNTGNAPMTGISVAYTGGGSFALTQTPVATIYPGESSIVVISFLPTTLLPQQANYTISSNASNKPAFVINVNGSGAVAPEIRVLDDTNELADNIGQVSLGSVEAGVTKTKTFTITNSGTAGMTGVGASFAAGSSAAFQITKQPDANVAKDASTTLTVSFKPSANGPAAAVLLIASNDGNENPFHVNLTATGANVPEPEINVTENAVALADGAAIIDFGAVPTNLTVTKTFTIKNTGAAALAGISVGFAPGSSGAFSFVTPPVPATNLAKNATTTFAVKFGPNSVASFNAALQIASNDPDEAVFDINLTGTGQATLAPTFTTPPANVLVRAGESADFSAAVTGALPMSFQWKKNGAKVSVNGTSRDLHLAPVKTGDAGAYTLFASNSAGTNTSPPAFFGVVTKTGGRVLLKEDALLTLTCTATAPTAPGVSLQYQWHDADGPLLNAGRISGADTKTLKIAKVGLGDTGNYSCTVTLVVPGDDPQCDSGDVMVSVVKRPTLHPIVLGDVSVGETVNADPITADFAAKFTAAGLPPGVTLNGETGILGGKPTAAKIVNGVVAPYRVIFTATNPAGTSDPLAVDWTVQPLAPSLIGTFNGLVERDPFTNFGFGGTIQITTTSKGAITGSITLAGQKHPVTGFLDASLGDNPSASLKVKRTPPSLGELTLAIDSIEINGDRLSGSIYDEQFGLVESQLVLGDGTPGADNGAVPDARVNGPRGIVLLGEGGFMADTGNHIIRKVENDTVTIFAGEAGISGNANGAGAAARFNGPEGLALDAALNLFVADTGNGAVRKITPDGQVSTVTVPVGTFVSPCALVFDDKGNLIVVDRGNHTIRKIAPNGTVTVLAGKDGIAGYKDGSGTGALFNAPHGITFDAKMKAFFVADTNNRAIRKVTPTGIVTTYAGAAGIAGDAPGMSVNARFIAPVAITGDGQGSLIVADTLLVQITPGGIVATVSDYVDAANHVDQPRALAYDPIDGSILAADAGLHGVVNHHFSDPLPSANFVARRNVWTAASPVDAAHVGSYTAGIATTQGGDDAFPQGQGYATLAISKTGTAIWGGKSADGSGLTCSTIVGPEGEILLHTMLYKNTGSIQGITHIDDSLDFFTSGSVDEPFDWYKVAQAGTVTDRVYKGGFMLHGLNLLGGKYTPANNIFDFLGLAPTTTTGNAKATFGAGGLPAPFEQLLDVKTPSSLTVPSANNPNGVKLSVVAGTGVFTGSFNQGSRKATIAGVLLRNTAGNVKAGRGYFLLPQDTTTNGPMLSGQVVIDGN